MVTQRQKPFMDDMVLHRYLVEAGCYDAFVRGLGTSEGSYPGRNPERVLYCAFNWRSSPEGDTFWRRLGKDYEERYPFLSQTTEASTWFLEEGV